LKNFRVQAGEEVGYALSLLLNFEAKVTIIGDQNDAYIYKFACFRVRQKPKN